MYSECVRCERIGASCDGPHFVSMSTQELLTWCKARKKFLGLSNAQLADLTGGTLPKGTIDRLFAGEHTDVRFETVRPLLKALTGGARSGNPCAAPQEDEALRKRVQELEAERQRLEAEVQAQKENAAAMKTLIASTNRQNDDQLAFLRDQVKQRARTSTVMTVIAVAALLYIIVTLIIDLSDPARGYYWLDGLLHLPQGIVEQFGTNM